MLSLKQQFLEVYERYGVEDLDQKEAKVIFLLESPHTVEIAKKVPAAGGTGKSMSGLLFGCKKPLGLLLKENLNKKPYNQVGIMNVCPMPMQRGAYKKSLGEQGMKEFLSPYTKLYDIFKDLRDVKGQSADHNSVLDIVVNDLSQRLDHLIEKDIVIVPCGNFARIALKLAEKALGTEWETFGIDISHPARPIRDWSTMIEEAEKLKRLKKRFDQKLRLGEPKKKTSN